jgi:hypothetical protein
VLQRITTALGLNWVCTDYDPEDYEKRILAAISGLKSLNSIAKSDIKKLDREIEILQETLESANSLHEIQIEGRDAALRGSTETFKKLNQKIQILEENLTRSESDRLAELTAIMRLIQAFDIVPIERYSGAVSLIKAVLYQSICKLDPSQKSSL